MRRFLRYIRDEFVMEVKRISVKLRYCRGGYRTIKAFVKVINNVHRNKDRNKLTKC